RGGGDRGARPTSARGRPMVTSRLFLTGIAAAGRHGGNPGGKDQGADVALDVEGEVGAAELTSTADYRTVIRTARETVERDSFDLLESLAHAVAKDVLAPAGGPKVSAGRHNPAAARRD